MATSRIADSVGRVLGDRYRLTRPLGVGASANVFAAEDVRLRRRVAVKVLHPALAGEEAFLRRFRREAQAVAALRHPNILRVYDWGEDGGAPYLVMELLEGGSLRSMLDRGHLLSAAQAATVGADAARALDYAHRQGLVHRDIKPANLLFDEEGRVSIADFGLARALAEATWTEPAGAVVGTARYASPELVRGEHLDSKSDVYSLALVLVEAMTGQVPFVADTAFGTLMARVGRSLEAPDDTGSLKPILESAGLADPADRLDAGALARALDGASARLPFPARLALVSPLATDLVERDDASPTELPGRAKLFDRAEWEDDEDPARPTAAIPGSAVSTGPPGPAGPPGATVATGPAAGRNGTNGTPQPLAAGAVAGQYRPGGPGGPGQGSGGPGQGSGDPGQGSGRPGGGSGRPGGPHPRPAGGTGGGWSAEEENGAGSEGGPPRRHRFRWLVIVVVVVVLAAGGVGAWLSLSGRLKPMEPVPTVTRDTTAQATAALARVHLKLDVTGSTYDASIPTGHVVSQSPATGKLRQDSAVRVVLSKGPAPVPVPNLQGDLLQAAQQILAHEGLKYTVQPATSMTYAAGLVISNTPNSGTLLPGQSVTLVESVGKPKVAVPPVAQGTPYATAHAALAGAGFVVTETVQYNNTVANGAVISVSPASGTELTVGSTVQVMVSKGPHYVPVPETRNDSVGAAAQALTNAGLNPGSVNGNPLDTVSGTNPSAGTQVLYGSTVTIDTK